MTTQLRRIVAPASASGSIQNISANGRSYSAAPGSFLDVPYQDAAVMSANGWIELGPVGSTADRPTISRSGCLPGINGASYGDRYVDTTLGKMIVATADGWIDPASSSVV